MIKQHSFGMSRKGWISILAGIISLLLSPFGLVATIGEIQINLPWSLLFPIMVALAYGWRFALVAGLFGGALFPFLLWPNNGWPNVFTSLLFLGVYVLLGIAVEVRYFKKIQRLSIRIILAILSFTTSASFFYIFLFNRVLELNPPFWEPDAIKHLPLEVLYGFAFKDSINVLILVLAAETLLRLKPVRNLLGLAFEVKMQKNSFLFVVTMLVSFFVWLIFTILGVVLDEGTNELQDHHNSIALFVTITSGLLVARLLFYYNENQFNFQNELKKSEEKFRTLFEFAYDAILIIYDGIIIDCNAAALKVFACEFDHIIGKTPAFLSPMYQPDGMLSTEKATQKINKALLENYQQFEWQHQRLNGTPFDAEISLNKIEINSQILLQAIVRDITETKQSERLIQEQRNLSLALSKTSTLEMGLRLCLESAMNISGMDCGGFYMVDPATGSLNIVYHQGLSPEVIQSTSHYEANSAHAQLIFSGQPIYAEHQALKVPIDEVRKKEQLHAIAIIPILHEGRVISCLNIASHTFNEIPEHVRNMLEVITRQIGQVIARLKTEEALRESETKHRELVENLNDVIYSVGSNGIISFVSPPVRMLSGYEPEELIGESLFKLIHPADADYIKRGFGEVLNGRLLPRDYRILSKKGQVKWVRSSSRPIVRGEDTIGVQGVMSDITELKHSEQALILAKDKAEESDRLKTAFLQNLSHEIRTPLNSIMGFASLLPEENSKSLIDNYSSIIVENSEQLVHIIDDIVLYSRLQSKQLTNNSKEFDINTLLVNIRQSFNLPEFQKGVNLAIDTFSSEPIKIFSDYEKIWQVYTNLISNAFKYTNKGTITFGITEIDSKQIFFVKDTGIGIPQNEVDHIFERFYRASNVDKGVIGGTGLGLSIVAELMELLGGEIWVESEKGKGSTFYFTIRQASNSTSIIA